MTAPLFEHAAQDAEMVVVAWLATLWRAGSAYLTGDPLPFRLVTQIGGTEDDCTELAEPVVSVHTLCDRTLGYANAMSEAKLTHRRMLRLGRYLDDITLPDSTVASVDYVEVFQPQIWVPFEDVMILRKVGRYKIGLTYEPVT